MSNWLSGKICINTGADIVVDGGIKVW